MVSDKVGATKQERSKADRKAHLNNLTKRNGYTLYCRKIDL